ncbi:competence protein CoiA family protein [Ureibacillus sinduriensis]|uniref:Competence protein CoiA-like N-terminal domain-containing protein n=1 Tax=Ureibacillus sinduriensis BLB-1 = JCM 15800 TaxID=1384057 RepID=A0A0A3HWJ1_9BACL|nr:hypothetical protein [Ureibacillus sinduriensis]KGR74718.1 hypothetical protein CD33_16710 [Ureibacillus sinduriensis BLB-1 = JCM 15800]
MRIAKHVIDNYIFEIPLGLNKTDIINLKRVTEKGTYKCAFCGGRVRIESGDVKGTYFSHFKDESCIANASKLEKAYLTYKNQIMREEPKQQIVVSLLKNELEGLKKIYSHLKVDLGYNIPIFQTHLPDVVVELGEGKKKYAMSVVTKINKESDLELSETLKKRNQYFIKLGFEPIWFVERSHEAREYRSREIVFWESEKNILQQSKEDKEWTRFLKDLTPSALRLSEILGIKKILKSLTVQSIMYLSPKDNGKFLIYRFIEELETNPCRAYLINEPYEMTMGEALSIHENEFLFAVSEKEKKGREVFNELYKEAEKNIKAEIEVQKPEREKVLTGKDERANIHSNVENLTISQRQKSIPTGAVLAEVTAVTEYTDYLNSFSLETELNKMTKEEKFIFNNLIEKYNLTRENYPGLCKVALKKGKYIHTPHTLWQLWILDQILTTFRGKQLTAKMLYQEINSQFRFDYKFKSKWDLLLYEYLLLLEDIGLLRTIKRSIVIDVNTVFSVQLETLPLINDFKMNSYIAFYYSQYFDEDSQVLDEVRKIEVRKAYENYKAILTSL